MQILLTCPNLDPIIGGPAVSVSAIRKALAEDGHDVTLAAALPQQDLDRSEVLALDHITAATHAFDIVHDNGLWMPFHLKVRRLAEKRGIPRIVSTRGMLEPWALKHKALKKKLALLLYQRAALRAVSGFMATSESEAAAIRDFGLTQPIAIVPNPVPLPESTRPERGVRDQRTFLFVSRIHKKKGLAVLLEAFQQVQPEGWEIAIHGPDQDGHQKTLEALAGALGIEDKVRFCGPVYGDEKRTAFETADVFVLPTYSENFGNVIAESMAYGLPVITTTGTPWKSIRDNNLGWWIEPAVPALAQAIMEAVALSDAQRDEIGQRAKVYINELISPRAIAGQVEGFYRYILGNAPKPDFVV